MKTYEILQQTLPLSDDAKKILEVLGIKFMNSSNLRNLLALAFRLAGNKETLSESFRLALQTAFKGYRYETIEAIHKDFLEQAFQFASEGKLSDDDVDDFASQIFEHLKDRRV